MAHVCARCSRLGLTVRAAAGASLIPLASLGAARQFSSTRASFDGEDDSQPQPSGKPLTASGTSLPAALRGNNVPQRSRPAPGPILRRTGPPRATQPGAPQGRSAPPPGLLLRRVGMGAGSSSEQPRTRQEGAVLRRTGGPRSRVPQRSGNRSAAGPPGQRRTDSRVFRAENRKKRADADAEEAEADLGNLNSQVENYISTVVDPPQNPIVELPYNPGRDLSIQELRADWPPTPLSTTGLTESVQQRIEFLAHRIPHGYQTPRQLAEHYTKGYLTRFESEEEKETVLTIAKEMAVAQADEETEKTQQATTPKEMGFEDLVSRNRERQGLADTYVRGKYPEVVKQKMPFLDQIVRNLNNNATYASANSEAFMETVQRLVVSRQTEQGQTPKQPATQK